MDSIWEPLGEVVLPSGTVMVADTGTLRLWCHDRPPRMPDGVLSSEAATQSANRAQDFRLDGPDAEKAGLLYGRQWHPKYLFDIPGHELTEFQETFKAFVMQRGLNARLIQQFPRIPHTRRVQLALEQGKGAGELQVHGVPTVVVGELPRARKLRVIAERRRQPPFAGMWNWVGLEVQPDAAVENSQLIGRAGVDWAKLLFVDPATLGRWQHDESIDGLADFVFWGPDAEKARDRFGAKQVVEDQYGWLNLPVEEALHHGYDVEQEVAKGELRLATDYRPHSHHHQLLEQLRTSPTESGSLELEGGRCFALFTGWGDGVFPVYRDVDSEGKTVRVRVELATPETIEGMRRVNASAPRG